MLAFISGAVSILLGLFCFRGPLQSVLLLRWRSDTGRIRWFWLERKSDVSHWDALRRAVYSRASAPIPAFPARGKEPPPAGPPPAAEQ